MKSLTRAVCATAAVVALVPVAMSVAWGSSERASSAASTTPATQCSTKLLVLRPHYADPVKTLSGASSSLSGAGSTFVNPIMSIWASQFASHGTKVAYQSIGSGGGVAQIQAQTVDFGASDVPMLDSELAAAKGGPILHIPLVLGAVVVSYHLGSVHTQLRFDGETVGKIFAGEITNWNDAAIKKLNPGVTLPNEPIAVMHRSDGSGTTGVFTDWLTRVSPSWVSKLGGATLSHGKTVAWPVGIGGKGNEGVSALIGQQEGAVGYVGLEYAVPQHLKYALIKNSTGNFMQPCVSTITAAANNTKFAPDLRTSLTNRSNPNAYPITATTFALVYQNQTDAGKARAMVNFLSWLLTVGQNSPYSIDYAPLGKQLDALSLQQLNKIKVNGVALVHIAKGAN